MPNHDYLLHRARAFSASDHGTTYAEGVIVGVADFATFVIEAADGTLVHWGTHLTEIGPEVSDEELTRIRQSRQQPPPFNSLRWLVIEGPTDLQHEWLVPEHGEHGEITAYSANRDAMPAAYADALDKVNADVDAAMCGLADLMDEATGQMCSNTVGWVLHEPNEPGDSGGLSWRWTALVETAGGVVAVCEECTPDNLYESAAVLARRQSEFEERREGR